MEIQKIAIKKVLDQMNSDVHQIMLPAIQRKMVWDEEKIIKFIDSILMEYPIGVFLFWSVSRKMIDEKKKKGNEYIFYEFLRECKDYEIPRNREMNELVKSVPYYAVLDGQQRLTALNIALRGYIITKEKVEKNKIDVKKYLCLNLASDLSKKEVDEGDDIDTYFDIKFLSTNELKDEKYKYWRKFNHIISSIETIDDIYTYADSINIEDTNTKRIVEKNLGRVFKSLYNNYINYYEIPECTDMDEILNIFIRVNSGGEVLQMTDLLFSTIINKFQKARDEIDDFIDFINRKEKGKTFDFTIDFVMRTCFYLIGKSINMKVKNFTEDNINKIMEQWDRIKLAFTRTVDLLENKHFNDSNISSYNAIMPIILYAYNKDRDFKNEKEINEIYKYFVIGQVNRIFGGSSNSVLERIRNNINKIEGDFELKELEDVYVGGSRKGFKVEKEDIDEWFILKKSKLTYLILSLLRPNTYDPNEPYHQDHMHPDTSLGKRPEFAPYKDKLANLQIISWKENESKGKTSLKEWLKTHKDYAQLLPSNVSYELDDFLKFYLARRNLLKEKLFEKFGFEFSDDKDKIVDIEDIKRDIKE